MYCPNHPNKKIKTQCESCGAGMCSVCAKKYHVTVCDSCASAMSTELLLEAEKKIRNTRVLFIVTYIIFVIGIIALALSGTMDGTMAVGIIIAGIVGGIGTAYYIASIPSGWRVLNKGLAAFRFILFLPLMGWIIFYMVKLSLAMMIGVFVLPKEYFAAKRTIKNLKQL